MPHSTPGRPPRHRKAAAQQNSAEPFDQEHNGEAPRSIEDGPQGINDRQFLALVALGLTEADAIGLLVKAFGWVVLQPGQIVRYRR